MRNFIVSLVLLGILPVFAKQADASLLEAVEVEVTKITYYAGSPFIATTSPNPYDTHLEQEAEKICQHFFDKSQNSYQTYNTYKTTEVAILQDDNNVSVVNMECDLVSDGHKGRMCSENGLTIFKSISCNNE